MQLFENYSFLMATCLSRRNGILECWNAGILGIKAENKPFKLKKLLQTQHSTTPLFHYSNWGEAPKFPPGVPVAAGQGLSWQRFFYSSTVY